MDFDQLRELLRGNLFQHVGPTQTDLSFFSTRLRTLSQVPKKAIENLGAIFKMIPGAGYIAGRLKEAQDPKVLRCWSFEEVHECHREPGIMHGYRSENCSVLQAVISLFRVTNETVNFWTHFLPSLYFVWLFSSLASTMPLFTDAYLFPFVWYMIASCAYPLVSCLAHAFSCLSLTATHVCFFMDYATLSVYSWGAAVLYYSYVFPQTIFPTVYGSLFLPVAAIMAVLTTLMACLSRLVSSITSSRALRLSAFVIPYVWASAPLIWRLVFCEHYNDTCERSGIHHTRQFYGVFLASFFYGTRLPERLAPGRFDFVGHSHNFLHLFGIAATHEQLKGALIDMEGRRGTLESLQGSFSPKLLTGVSLAIILTNIAIIVAFTRKLKICDDTAKTK